MARYADAVANTNLKAGNESTAAHIVFANSKTREAQKEFVLKHGPVLAEPASVRVTTARYVVRVRAEQRLDVLAREQQTLSAVMQLFEQIRSEAPDHEELFRAAQTAVAGTRSWLRVSRRCFAAKRTKLWQERPSWLWTLNDQVQAEALRNAIGLVREDIRWKERVIPWGHDPHWRKWAIPAARRFLCQILNAFPTKLTDYDGAPLEIPSEDVTCGILPVLYYFLRREYFGNARIARCALKDCVKWFRMGAHTSLCCSSDHSLKYRQAEYYARKGKATRAARRKRQKKERKERS